MHVTKFLDFLGFGEDVEVVVAGLPNELLGPAAGEPLFNDLDGEGEFYLVRFGDK